MITHKNLEAAGCKSYPSGAHLGSACKCLWQKWIEKDDVRLYAIDIYEYDLPRDLCGLEPKVVLYLATGEDVDLGLLCNSSTTVEVIDVFYARMYSLMGCVPDKHHQR